MTKSKKAHLHRCEERRRERGRKGKAVDRKRERGNMGKREMQRGRRGNNEKKESARNRFSLIWIAYFMRL